MILSVDVMESLFFVWSIVILIMYVIRIVRWMRFDWKFSLVRQSSTLAFLMSLTYIRYVANGCIVIAPDVVLFAIMLWVDIELTIRQIRRYKQLKRS